MGGMRTNSDGAAYGLKNLFLAGESACWDLHGFNRLAGNSLAETVVAGRHWGPRWLNFCKAIRWSCPPAWPNRPYARRRAYPAPGEPG